MKIIVFTFLFCHSLYAHEIVMDHKGAKYKLTNDQKLIKFEDSITSLTFSAKECNSHIIEGLNKKIERFLGLPLLEVERDDLFKIKIDEKIKYASRYGERALFFFNMQEEIKKLKTEELLNCK